jgi:hypothetical protein
MMLKRYKVEIIVYQSAIVNAETEEDAKETALDMHDIDREWCGEQVTSVYRCDEVGEMTDEQDEE